MVNDRGLWFSGERWGTIPRCHYCLPRVLLWWLLNVCTLPLVSKGAHREAPRQLNCSIIKRKVWPGQDPSEISLEIYQITSQCSDLTVSTNKPSEEYQTGCQLHTTKSTQKKSAAPQQCPGSMAEMWWDSELWLGPVHRVFWSGGVVFLVSSWPFALSWIQACTGLFFSRVQTQTSCSFKCSARSFAVHLIVCLSFCTVEYELWSSHSPAPPSVAHRCQKNKIKPSKLIT